MYPIGFSGELQQLQNADRLIQSSNHYNEDIFIYDRNGRKNLSKNH